MGGGDRFLISPSNKEEIVPMSSPDFGTPRMRQVPTPQVLSPHAPLNLPAAFNHSGEAGHITAASQTGEDSAMRHAGRSGDANSRDDAAAAPNVEIQMFVEAANTAALMDGSEPVPILLDSNGLPLSVEAWWNGMIDQDLLNDSLLGADYHPLMFEEQSADQIAIAIKELQRSQQAQQAQQMPQPQAQQAQQTLQPQVGPNQPFAPSIVQSTQPNLTAPPTLHPPTVQPQSNIQGGSGSQTQAGNQTTTVDPPFMFTLPYHIFNMNKLRENSLEVMKLYVPSQVSLVGILP
ncbi:hypothetical protein AA313_de0202600 [Arthrobotrys entomopaga]|nr:hypothetical protein AA313_de0202600 [Arthrobotrys entomopaga]